MSGMSQQILTSIFSYLLVVQSVPAHEEAGFCPTWLETNRDRLKAGCSYERFFHYAADPLLHVSVI